MELPKAYELASQVWMVPCQLIIDFGTYSPLIKPFETLDKAKDPRSRHSWKIMEDQNLARLVEKHGSRNWSSIAKDLNRIVHKSIPYRNGKQCRERWMNQLDPKLSKNSWTIEEDLLIIRMQSEIGNKWSQISKVLQGRTESQVKNRWKRLKKTKKVTNRNDFQTNLFENEKKRENQFQGFYKGSPLALDDLEGAGLTDSLNDRLVNDCKVSQNRLDDMSPIRVPSFISDNDCNINLMNFSTIHDADIHLENKCLEKSNLANTSTCINSYSMLYEQEYILSTSLL